MLTSRQLAVVMWLVIFVVFVMVLALTQKNVRSSVVPLLKTLFASKLLVSFAIIIGYNAAVVWFLWQIGYWDASMLYDTLAFIAVGGIGSVARAASWKGTYDWRFYLKTVLVNLGLMVVLIFLLDLFSLNFWLWFLVIMPLATLVSLLVVVSGYQKGAEQAHRFLSGVQTAIGFLLLAYVIWWVVANYQDLLHLRVVLALGLPFVMSVLFVPLLIFICAVFAYESAFLVVTFKISNDRGLARWKKRALFLRFGLNLKTLQAFRRSPAMQEYAWVKTKEEARDALSRDPSSLTRTDVE